MLQHLEYKYNKSTRPDHFVCQFKNIQEFEEWCYINTVGDLKYVLQEFEKYELYEYCAVLKSVIKSLLDAMIVFDAEF